MTKTRILGITGSQLIHPKVHPERQIHSVERLTDNKYVNLYSVKATSVHDTPVSYYVASRAKSVEELKLKGGQ